MAAAGSPPAAGRPANLYLFLLRLFRGLAAVVLRHRRVQTLGQNHFHSVTGFAHHLSRPLQSRFLHGPEHVLFTATERMVRTAAETQPRKLLRAYRANHRLRAVEIGRASCRE